MGLSFPRIVARIAIPDGFKLCSVNGEIYIDPVHYYILRDIDSPKNMDPVKLNLGIKSAESPCSDPYERIITVFAIISFLRDDVTGEPSALIKLRYPDSSVIYNIVDTEIVYDGTHNKISSLEADLVTDVIEAAF